MDRTIAIQRLPLNISPSARINSYNHHALAPWLEQTGYLTPLYFFYRERALGQYDMARWLVPAIRNSFMLTKPSAIIELPTSVVEKLLSIASKIGQDRVPIERFSYSLHYIAATLPQPEMVPEGGFFVRLSKCSPKDVDGGNQKPVFTIYEALMKLVASKRARIAFRQLAHGDNEDQVDNKLYLFPYVTDLDRLSEWRCYVHRGQVTAISQSRFYASNHAGITDSMLEELVRKIRKMWHELSDLVAFDSCVLDVYAKVREPDFQVRLIEFNPHEAHLGSGSLLFHWIDDEKILLPKRSTNRTVLRIVDDGPSVDIGRDQAKRIGKADVIVDEWRVLKQRKLEWILADEAVRVFSNLSRPDYVEEEQKQHARAARLLRYTQSSAVALIQRPKLSKPLVLVT